MSFRILLLAFFIVLPAHAMKDKIHMFPKPSSSQDRFVISLPPLKNEHAHKIELVFGKQMNIDCNRHSLTGKLEKISLKGWGYSYYNFSSNGQTVSTKMGCMNQSTRSEFITAHTPELIRYNSRLPIVIYTPKGISVKYKVWSGDPQAKAADKK